MTKGTLSARMRAKAEPDEIDAGEAENITDEVSEASAEPETDQEISPEKKIPSKPAAKTPSRSIAKPKAATKADGVNGSSGMRGGGNLQDQFLNHLRREKAPVTMFLVKGVKLQGIVTWFDNFSILLRRDGQSQLVYKHAVSTIMPGHPIDAEKFGTGANAGRKQRMLQDIFLSRVRDAAVQVTMFLVNGVMLQGRIADFDQFCMMLEREGYVQLAYKHAVSTIQPAVHVDLTNEAGEDDTDGDDAGV